MIRYIGLNSGVYIPKTGEYTFKNFPDYFIYKEGGCYVGKNPDGAPPLKAFPP